MFRSRRLATTFAALALPLIALCSAACGNPHDPSITYTKLTPEEFAKLPPEEQETPEVQENMGADWKDPNLPENATNPKRRKRH
ncbi:oxidoreductase [Planctomyces sp. SH-PL62]|uniref:oxidoreductase n=1 Tax=Planctomyces sp. SH-PL62 TaxID=1636152 RepID=UPI00078C72B5|nr:oxidoreductase [Planctomyces sp. SH-PL62]AMV36494.1 hypothetical protein VT85_03615 [Planctomyces sp. SH-PL62]